MTPAQISAFKTAILAESDPALVAARNAGNHVAMAEWYAADSAVIVWRATITTGELTGAVIDTEYLNAAITQGHRDLLRLYASADRVHTGMANVRTALGRMFGGGTTTRANLTAAAKRPANRLEAVFASGGAGTTATPHDLVVDETPTSALIGAALRS